MARSAAVVALVLAVAACRAPLLGTNDVELDYAAPAGTELPDTARVDVRLRLLANQLDADVSRRDDGGLRVVVDGERAEMVERLLRRPSGLVVAHLDPVTREPGAAIVDLEDAYAIAAGKHVLVQLPASAADALAAEHGQVALLLRGKPLWRGAIDDVRSGDTLVVPRATDITGYRAARTLARSLDAPSPPVMTRTARVELPIDWGLAIGCLAIPILAALGWMFFVRRLDRARPEPWWLLVATALLGAGAQLLAGFIEVHGRDLSPYLDLRTMTLDHSKLAFVIALGVATVTIGVIEEGAKLLAVWALALRRREFDEPVDGIVFAAASAIGFATMENIKYFTSDRLADGHVAARSLECVSGHMMYAAFWGYALGQRLVTRRPGMLRWFLLAAVLHGLWDTCSELALPYDALVLTAVLTALFVLVLRRALRWGVVEPGAPPIGTRTLFPVGRTVPCVIAVLSTFGFAYLLMDLGNDAQWAGYRVSLELLGRSAVYATLFVGATWGVATLMPLDVAVDDAGLTFAGATLRWADVRAVRRPDSFTVAVQGPDRELRLGPGTRATLDALEAAVRARASLSEPDPPPAA